MNFILRLFLTFSAVSFFLVVCLVQNKVNLVPCLTEQYQWTIYLAYTLVPFALTAISVIVCKQLSASTIEKVKSIETSNNDFLANYLAYFFVALSINDVTTFWVVFGMTILFTFFSRVSYFNPVFLIFGFNFYYVYTCENVKIMLICRKRLRSPDSFESMTVRRINDYTFMEV